MKEVPKDGDCALHAVVDQLRQNDEHILVHSVESLRRSAVQLLEKHPIDVNFFDRSEYDSFDKYLKQQSIPKTWCDELMLRRISDVVDRKIVIINENGHETLIVPQIKTQSHSQALQKTPLFLGLMTDYHYVSLVPKDDGVTTSGGARKLRLGGAIARAWRAR